MLDKKILDHELMYWIISLVGNSIIFSTLGLAMNILLKDYFIASIIVPLVGFIYFTGSVVGKLKQEKT